MQLSTLFKKFSIDKRFLCNVKFSVKNFCDTSTTTYCVFLFFIYLYIVVFAVGRSLTCKRSQIRVLSSPPKALYIVLLADMRGFSLVFFLKIGRSRQVFSVKISVNSAFFFFEYSADFIGNAFDIIALGVCINVLRHAHGSVPH